MDKSCDGDSKRDKSAERSGGWCKPRASIPVPKRHRRLIADCRTSLPSCGAERLCK
ncbi:MAG: hypothetical protein J6C09_03885 [Clostridia bacterium]|nr:hypothetical protein [Clostridia bacterium]